MSLVADFPVAGAAGRHRMAVAGGGAAPASPGALSLLAQARRDLLDAEWEAEPAQKFATAYLSALRAAAAMLALRGRPHRQRAKPTSAWTLLGQIAPELAEWAVFFAAFSSTNAAVQSGITRVVSQRTADDLVRQTGQFLALVSRAVPDA